MNTMNFIFATTASIGFLADPAAAVSLAPTNYPDRIFDTFSRDAAFNSSQADSGQMWNASSWSTDGTQLQINGTGVANLGSGFLAVERSYELSLDMAFGLSDNGRAAPQRLAFGFSTAPTLGSPGPGTLGGSIWTNTGDYTFFGELPTVSQSTVVGSQGSHQFSVTLTTGQSLSDSELVWRVDGTQVGSGVMVDASRVNGIFLESLDGGFGRVDNLRLSEANAVPEPSSLFLSGVALIGLVCRRRR